MCFPYNSISVKIYSITSMHKKKRISIEINFCVKLFHTTTNLTLNNPTTAYMNPVKLLK